jgi:hypothetical protein
MAERRETIGVTGQQLPGGKVSNPSGSEWPPKIPGITPPDPFAEFRQPSHQPKNPRKKRWRRRNSRKPRPPIVSVTRVLMGAAMAALLILLVVVLVWQF